MKHLLKGIAALAITMIISMAIHMFCNMHGIDLNSALTTVVSATCALAVYHTLIRNEKE